MTFDFDTVPSRAGIGALTTDFARAGKSSELLPMWVADTAFPAPEGVLEALQRRVKRGIFGYSVPPPGYDEAVTGWMERRHGWPVEPAWLVQTPGVVCALYLAVRAFTQPGDGVLINTPAYPPFFSAITDNGRRLLTSPLVGDERGHHTIDLEDLDAKAAEASLLILCSPHNPTGRVWTREELEAVADIALRHDLTVVADEIHHDLVYAPAHHTPFATLAPEVAARTLTCTAPSKTFNLAGLQLANMVVPDAALRRAFTDAYHRSGLSQVGALGLTACEAAYRTGDAWLDALTAYLAGNLATISEAVAALPARPGQPPLQAPVPEGTYLQWLDLRGLGLDQPTLARWCEDEAGLWLNDGAAFGPEGTGHMRLNAAQPRAVIQEAAERLTKAVRRLLA